MATESLLRSSCHGGAPCSGPLLKEPVGNTISDVGQWAPVGVDVGTSQRGRGERGEEPAAVGKQRAKELQVNPHRLGPQAGRDPGAREWPQNLESSGTTRPSRCPFWGTSQP